MAIIINKYDTEESPPINVEENVKEYLHLKWESLNSLLERNSYE